MFNKERKQHNEIINQWLMANRTSSIRLTRKLMLKEVAVITDTRVFLDRKVFEAQLEMDALDAIAKITDKIY